MYIEAVGIETIDVTREPAYCAIFDNENGKANENG